MYVALDFHNPLSFRAFVVTKNIQPIQEAVSYRGLFTAGWFGVREKYCSRLKIYDRLRASEQADYGLILN